MLSVPKEVVIDTPVACAAKLHYGGDSGFPLFATCGSNCGWTGSGGTCNTICSSVVPDAAPITCSWDGNQTVTCQFC
jgi:hypothetical protein